MSNKARKYSWAAQKDHTHRIRWIVVIAALFFVLYLLLQTFAVSAWVLENDSMAPNLRRGDCFVFFSRSFHRLFPNPGAGLRRGQIVLVDRSGKGAAARALDTALGFFTAWRLGTGGRDGQVFLKRIIGFPGDEISITNFVARIKPRGGDYGFTEFELRERTYTVDIPQIPALWDEALPFSGNMDPVVLGDDEWFVLSDSRINTNDSRTWGPVSPEMLSAAVLFRYWPLTRFGVP